MRRPVHWLTLVLFAFAAALALSFARAADIWHTSTVRQIYPLADGSFVLIFNQDSPSCLDANNPNYHYVTVGQNGMTLEGAKKVYAIAMLAFSMGKQLQINFNDAGGCYINRAAIVE